MNLQLAASHTVASTRMSNNEVNTVEDMEEFRQLSDREIEHLIDLWRQEEFLRSLDINAKKTAMLNISKQMSGINTGKDTLHRPTLIMVALCNRADHYIFALLFLSSIFYLSSFFLAYNFSGRRLDVYHTLTHGVALVRI